MRRAGLAGHAPKDLRDTFASWLASLGVPVAWVSDVLGHSSWAVTARHYARWIDDTASRELPPTLGADDVAGLVGPGGARSSPETTPRGFLRNRADPLTPRPNFANVLPGR